MNIHLPLHPSVTKDECGECPRGITRTSDRWRNVFGDVHNGRRLPACIAASAEAERVERQAHLGAAILATGITADVAAKKARDLRSLRGSLMLSAMAHKTAYDIEIAVFDAIATALRSEVPE